MKDRRLTIEEAKKRILFFVRHEDEPAARQAMNDLIVATMDAVRSDAQTQTP